jgi:uncharacterized protein (TIGR03066 family)
MSRRSKNKNHHTDHIRAGEPPLRQVRGPGPASHAAAVTGTSHWRWVVQVLCLIVAAAGTWAATEFFILSKLPRELLGKWVVTHGEQEGATFDFYRNGTMEGRINVRGNEGIVRASVRVEDKTLFSTTTNPNTGQSLTRSQTIVTLTDRNLVLQDDRGQLLKMERAD